jgi:hypothetical protein
VVQDAKDIMLQLCVDILLLPESTKSPESQTDASFVLPGLNAHRTKILTDAVLKPNEV